VNERKTYRNLSEFYPFYLSEHVNRTSRRLHFVGTSLAVVLLGTVMITQNWWLIALAVIQGYAFAWVGHFFFEHNEPAAFQYPRLSFMGDWRLWYEILTGKVKF
jgi:hypothetical protein